MGCGLCESFEAHIKPTSKKKTQVRTIDWVYKRYVKPKAMGYILNKGYVIW